MEAIILNALVCLGIEITKETYRKMRNDSPRGGLADIRPSMGSHTEAYREVETPNIVEKIAKSSVVFDQSKNELNASFFYTKNNYITKQLLGSDTPYFAFDSITDMFETLSMWNLALVTHASNIKRSSTIYLLDPHLATIRLPHMEFFEYFMNVTIVNHVEANQMLLISSVKIHKGCSVKFEHLTLHHGNIDVTDGGTAYLHKCIVGGSAPALNIPTITSSHNWQNDPRKVIFRDCILKKKRIFFPFGSKRNDYLADHINGILSQKIVRGKICDKDACKFYNRDKDGGMKQSRETVEVFENCVLGRLTLANSGSVSPELSLMDNKSGEKGGRNMHNVTIY